MLIVFNINLLKSSSQLSLCMHTQHDRSNRLKEIWTELMFFVAILKLSKKGILGWYIMCYFRGTSETAGIAGSNAAESSRKLSAGRVVYVGPPVREHLPRPGLERTRGHCSVRDAAPDRAGTQPGSPGRGEQGVPHSDPPTRDLLLGSPGNSF